MASLTPWGEADPSPSIPGTAATPVTGRDEEGEAALLLVVQGFEDGPEDLLFQRRGSDRVNLGVKSIGNVLLGARG